MISISHYQEHKYHECINENLWGGNTWTMQQVYQIVRCKWAPYGWHKLISTLQELSTQIQDTYDNDLCFNYNEMMFSKEFEAVIGQSRRVGLWKLSWRYEEGISTYYAISFPY